MEILKHRSSLHACVAVLTFLWVTSEACVKPSSPQCFRRKAAETVYICEWSTGHRNATFDLYFRNERKFRGFNKTSTEFNEEELITRWSVDIWVEAHVGNSSCSSNRTSVTLGETIKYDAPEDIVVSWLKDVLVLRWTAPEEQPSLAEVWFRQDLQESWEKLQRNTTTDTIRKNSPYRVVVMNLLKHSVYQVQIRHRSTTSRNPLWSDWSPLVTVPAELEHEPNVTVTKKLLNGTRELTLNWKPAPHAAAVGGVTYLLTDTQSLHGCPCRKKKRHTNTTKTTYTTFVSYSAVNVSVTARNAAGSSPPTVVQLPPEPAADLKPCDKTLLDEEFSETCLEWYELQDGDVRPGSLTLTSERRKKRRKQIKEKMKEYVRYLYFEHRCINGKPQTVKICLFYYKEEAPDRPPQDFSALSETHSSVDLSWRGIPSEHQRGFLTHYSLCSVKVSSPDEGKECRNISASLTKYRLKDLSPASKYNISLCGATSVGGGPKATATITTLPETPVNVWLSFGLLFIFFFISTMCTFILKRVKNRIFPPVPMPVIPEFTSCQPECQAMMEGKEEVHELTLYQLQPEATSVPEDAEDTTVFRGQWDEDAEGEGGDRGTSEGHSDECLSPDSMERELMSSREAQMAADLQRVDNEITMLIYRNGLVFDMKTDSS